MIDLKLSYSEYSALIQALLNRMDFLTEMIKRTSTADNYELNCIYKDDFSSVYDLYIRLKEM